MGFTRYKILVDKDEKVLTDSSDKILVTSDYIDTFYSPEEIIAAVRSPLMHRYFKVYLLHEDETIKEDITQWVISPGSIEYTSESGQCRSTSLTLLNSKAQEIIGFNPKQEEHKRFDWRTAWVPGSQKKLWIDTKIQIITGMRLGNRNYEVSQGIFYLADPTYSQETANHTVSVQCYDKFAFLDGTIRGNSDDEWNIPINSAVKDVINSLIKVSWTKQGRPLDYKNVRFPVKYNSVRTAYTIKKTGENNEGEIIKDLTAMMGCDAKYDDWGYLNVAETFEGLDIHNHSIAWDFLEKEVISPSIQVNRSKIRNRITVTGANINGYLCHGMVENTNPRSLYNINGEFGIVSQRITDNLTYSDNLCTARARYELKKSTQQYVNISFSCPYIPHIAPGDLVRWSCADLGIDHEEFLVNSVSIPLNPTENMSLNITNMKDLPL